MKFLKGLRCMILSIYYSQRNYILKLKFNLCHWKCVIYFDFKKLLENELRFVTDVVLEYFAMLEV